MRKLIISILLFASLLMYPVAAAADLSKPLSICNANYDGMVHYMFSQAAAMGQFPTEADRQEVQDNNPCACVYEIIDAAALDMDAGDVRHDMILIEEWVDDTKGWQGGKPYPFEKQLLIRELVYGETLLSTWGLGLMSCADKQDR